MDKENHMQSPIDTIQELQDELTATQLQLENLRLKIDTAIKLTGDIIYEQSTWSSKCAARECFAVVSSIND